MSLKVTESQSGKGRRSDSHLATNGSLLFFFLILVDHLPDTCIRLPPSVVLVSLSLPLNCSVGYVPLANPLHGVDNHHLRKTADYTITAVFPVVHQLELVWRQSASDY